MGLKRTRNTHDAVEAGPARRTRNKEPERPNKRARRAASPPPPSLPSRNRHRGRQQKSPDPTVHVRSPPHSVNSEPSAPSADELNIEEGSPDEYIVKVNHLVTFEGTLVQGASPTNLKLDKNMTYNITEMIPKSLQKAEAVAEQRRLPNLIREIKAEVIVGDGQYDMERTIATFQFVNDTTIGPKVIDLDAIEAMAEFVRNYAARVSPPSMRLNLSSKFGRSFKPPRTEILEPKMKQHMALELSEHFKCPDRTCLNFGSSCIQLNSEHVKIEEDQKTWFCDPGMREDKTMATTILELVISTVEKRSEKHPQTMARDEIKEALAQMPFLRAFLPRVRPLPSFTTSS